LVLVFFVPVVLPEEELEGAFLGLFCIGVGTGVGIDELVGVFNGEVRETL
jgi:hypothetical protein